jgi:hypothetical protein
LIFKTGPTPYYGTASAPQECNKGPSGSNTRFPKAMDGELGDKRDRRLFRIFLREFFRLRNEGMMINWIHIGPQVTAAFLASLVEFI